VRSRFVIQILVLVALALVATDAGVAARSAIACGSTITTDTTLDSNLRCDTTGFALVVKSATLDLNGHVVQGAGTGGGISLAGNGATVVNGTVRNFGGGVVSQGFVANTVIRNVRIVDNAGIGVSYGHGSAATIDSSTVSGNGGDGILGFDFVGLRVLSSTISRNGGSGINAELQLDSGDYEGNRITRNAGYGIFAWLSFTQAVGNFIARNGLDGIHFQETADPGQPVAYLIQDNVSRRNGGVGISACNWSSADPCAPGMIDGGGNRAYRNTGSPQCINIVCAGRERSDPTDDGDD